MNDNTTSSRIESDLLGNIKVPSDALYGAQTQRALENFPIQDQRTIGNYGCLIKGMMTIKQAAAKTNSDLSFLDTKIADTIICSAEMVLQK